ncbi:Cysteine-rich protein 1 [Galemys pyrenaicus]|uniref:Cysteine-rich protein 1 n=1 Tax=Galemys pyrenaicus TaxID=202257 RepID=A0A8J6AMT1_GALPY|nr:Cysteine-rich protein 1 [Galemys pyrenaicus]
MKGADPSGTHPVVLSVRSRLSLQHRTQTVTAMPKCPKCNKEVYFAERVTSLGKDWHRPCLKCEKCGKTLTSGGHAEHEGKPYCNHPCYAAMFGPKGLLPAPSAPLPAPTCLRPLPVLA